ncbi:hypothetical protein FE296_00215, partial [Paenibacillus sp. UASWS1643]
MEPQLGTSEVNNDVEPPLGTSKMNNGVEPQLGTARGSNDVIQRQEDDDFLRIFREEMGTKPLTVEETHTRDTFLIENQLLARLRHLIKIEDKGFKKRFINYVLEKEISKIERAKGIQ